VVKLKRLPLKSKGIEMIEVVVFSWVFAFVICLYVCIKKVKQI
jgi:hypothetical protein